MIALAGYSSPLARIAKHRDSLDPFFSIVIGYEMASVVWHVIPSYLNGQFWDLLSLVRICRQDQE
jgi:hypothetical protein